MNNVNKTYSVYRQYYGKIMATLISSLGASEFAMAQSITEQTFNIAQNRWQEEGEPADPEALLLGISTTLLKDKLDKRESNTLGIKEADDGVERASDEERIEDRVVQLMFACVHERLSPVSHVILILKNICGLQIDEIADALSTSSDLVEKTLSQGKRIISSSHYPLMQASALQQEKLHFVHTALHLMFSEGHAATQYDKAIRRELCVEAMKLLKMTLEVHGLPNHDTYAIMALVCFHSARLNARAIIEGPLIELELQDRELWDKQLIGVGIQYLRLAHDSNEISRFIYEAAIASVHCVAETFEQTNWPVIVGLYERLTEINSNPVTDLNRAAALYHVKGGVEALEALNKSRHLHWLKDSYLFYALLGKIYGSIGNGIEAIRNYEKALSLCILDQEREYLQTKISSLKVTMN